MVEPAIFDSLTISAEELDDPNKQKKKRKYYKVIIRSRKKLQ